jgi:hypothetical protein
MIIPSIIGIACGLLGGLRMPLPHWRLLGGFVALWIILVGLDLLVGIALFSVRSQHFTPSAVFWLSLGGGALIGAGVGYFVRPIWLKILQRIRQGRMQSGKTDVASHSS